MKTTRHIKLVCSCYVSPYVCVYVMTFFTCAYALVKTSLRATSYEPGNWAGSVIGMNVGLCSYSKFQPGRPG